MMGWTPEIFWNATMPDFWKHHHGFYLFHGGKEEANDDLPDPEVIAELESKASSIPPRKRKGAKIITDPKQIEERMRQAFGD